MFERAAALLAAVGMLSAQTPLENAGQPMRVAFECTAADTQAAGIGCSEEDPCPVYLELANVDAVGSQIVVAGNIHTPMATLDSILLASSDNGKSWIEPHERIPSAGLDQIQFADSQHAWISGANLQGAPRDPFFLMTSDGGKTWRNRPVFEETRVAAIESFHFDTASQGSMSIDASLDSGKREFYETQNGGASWTLLRTSSSGAPAPRDRQPAASPRVRTDAATRSYVIEIREDNRWRKIASFLVDIASCKE